MSGVRLKYLAMIFALWSAHPASAVTRALFVGIDKYSFSVGKSPTANADFIDLQGAVADVGLIKAVLAKVYQLQLDPGVTTPGTGCDTRNTVSITLTDSCATRSAILDAIASLTEASGPGDIILFYYAGHGGKHNAQRPDQIGGSNSTLVPSDAQRPPVDASRDILDTEIKMRIELAMSRGTSFVTLTDSCHSGTVTRDVMRAGRSRQAPEIAGTAPDAVPPADLPAIASPGNVRPYQVHLAAAGEEELANEIIVNGEHHGIFTRALAAVLAQKKGATYYEIAAEVRRQLEQYGEKPQLKLSVQNAQAEGELTARFLGAAPDPSRLYPGILSTPNSIDIHGGSLSGVTAGSSFAVQAGPDAADAILARGTVKSVTIDKAQLKTEAPVALPPGTSVFVRELSHSYGNQRLRVQIDGGDAAIRTKVERELARLSYVERVNDGAQFRIILSGTQASFSSADGSVLKRARNVASVDFPQRMSDVVRAAANYFALLGLRNDTGAAWGKVDFFRGECRPVSQCALKRDGDLPVIKVGDPIDIWISNKSTRPLYRYLLFLGARDYRISVLTPPDYSQDPPLTQGNRLLAFEGRLANSGSGTLLLLLTETPINVAALRQDPVRDITGATNELERLLLYAGTGQRGDTVVQSGNWGGTVASLKVIP